MGQTSYLFVFIILDTIGATISIPYFVDLIISLGGSSTIASLLIALRATSTAIAAPLLGSLSDKYGRKPVLYLVVLGSIATYILEVMSIQTTSIMIYAVSRLTFGWSRGATPAVNGAICDMTEGGPERNQLISRTGAMVGLGFLIGAGTGGFLVSFGYAVPSYVALVIQVLTLLFVATAVKEPAKLSESKKSDTSSKSKDATFLGTLKALATNADTQSVFFYHILIMVSFVGVQHAYLEYIRDNLKVEPGIRSIFLISVGLLTAVVQSNVNFSIRLFGGKQRTVIIGCIVNALINFYAPFSTLVPFVAVCLISSLFNFMPGITLGLISTFSPPNVQGSIMGFQETLINTATVIGPLFCSFAATFSHVIPFYASGALLLVGTFMALNLSALTKSDAEESVKKVSHKPLKTE